MNSIIIKTEFSLDCDPDCCTYGDDYPNKGTYNIVKSEYDQNYNRVTYKDIAKFRDIDDAKEYLSFLQNKNKS